MEYQVIIALNSIGKRKVGEIISQFEKRGLEFLSIKKVKKSTRGIAFPDMKTLILENQLEELDAMIYYKSKFSLKVLRKKLEHFRNNHVELLFESYDQIYDVQDLWEFLKDKVFMKGRKLPILFVLTDNGEVKIDDFILDDEFSPDMYPRLPSRIRNIRLGPNDERYEPFHNPIPLGPPGAYVPPDDEIPLGEK